MALLVAMTEAERARFALKVDRRGGRDACWPYIGCRSQQGYAIFQVRKGWAARAHRIAYFLATGLEPRIVRHRCDNPPCCNPRHLLSGTHRENMADMVERSRQARGERVATAKLTAERVSELRQRAARGESSRALARDCGVSQVAVNAAVRRATWRHIP